MDTNALKKWFLNEKRDLPWRNEPTPYAVWVSEVMLQQTQVSVVIPYFERWMKKFPTVKALAEAPLDEVIKVWEGLGYYSRARNLHEGAKMVLRDFGGEIPRDKGDLQKIKGLGPYTVGAILSFAFHEKEPAVDGNVVRVLARHAMIDKDIAKMTTLKEIRGVALNVLPDAEPWIVSEALIELGATICGRKPKCHECPLKRSCLACRHGIADKLPIKTVKTKTIHLTRIVPIISCGQELLVSRGAKGKVMCDLHEFPYIEVNAEEIENFKLIDFLSSQWGIKAKLELSLPSDTHTFTKYRVKLFPHHVSCKKKVSVDGYEWMALEKLTELAFSSGHRRVLEKYMTSLKKNINE